MLYYILMSDLASKKPIDEVLEKINLIYQDIQSIKTDIHHMKNYVRKTEVRESIKDDISSEYVKPKSNSEISVSKGWFW